MTSFTQDTLAPYRKYIFNKTAFPMFMIVFGLLVFSLASTANLLIRFVKVTPIVIDINAKV